MDAHILITNDGEQLLKLLTYWKQYKLFYHFYLEIKRMRLPRNL